MIGEIIIIGLLLLIYLACSAVEKAILHIVSGLDKIIAEKEAEIKKLT